MVFQHEIKKAKISAIPVKRQNRISKSIRLGGMIDHVCIVEGRFVIPRHMIELGHEYVAAINDTVQVDGNNATDTEVGHLPADIFFVLLVGVLHPSYSIVPAEVNVRISKGRNLLLNAPRFCTTSKFRVKVFFDLFLWWCSTMTPDTSPIFGVRLGW